MHFFFDMDGVQTCFDQHLRYVLSSNISDADINNRSPIYCMAMEHVLNKTKFFEDIPPSPYLQDFRSLFVELRQLGHSVSISSSTGNWCSMHFEIARQKMTWLEKHVHFVFDNICIAQFGADKARLATPNSVLIDDDESNCHAFGKIGKTVLYDMNSHVDGFHQILKFK